MNGWTKDRKAVLPSNLFKVCGIIKIAPKYPFYLELLYLYIQSTEIPPSLAISCRSSSTWHIFLTNSMFQPSITLSTLLVNSADNKLGYFSYLFPENKNWHFMQTKVTICRKCQNLFWGENISSAVCCNFLPSMLKFNYIHAISILSNHKSYHSGI